MDERELIKKLTQLKEIKPDENWVIFCRQNLAKKIRQEGAKTGLSRGFDLSPFLTFLRQLMPPRAVLKPVTILLIIFGLIFGTGLVTLAKTKNSLPGDRLFPVKIALEQAKLLAATSAEDKADLQNEMMTSRIQELSKIIENQELLETKQEKMEEAVANLQKQLLIMKDELPKLGNGDAKKMVEAAKKIDARAAQAEQTLSQAKTTLPSQTKALTEKIAEAVETADKTSNKALGVMVEKQAEATETISQEEIVTKLEEKIEKAEQKIKVIEQLLDAANIGNQLPINPAFVQDLLKKAQEILDDAKIDLQKNDISDALQKITTATEMVKSGEKLMENVIPPSSNEPGLNPENENTTTTPNTITPATATSSLLEIPQESSGSQVIPPRTSVQGSNIDSE